jgi:hypothetical protein
MPYKGSNELTFVHAFLLSVFFTIWGAEHAGARRRCPEMDSLKRDKTLRIALPGGTAYAPVFLIQ